MHNPEGSLTSAGAAGLRAAHQLLDGDPKLLADPVILQLLDPTQLDQIRSDSMYFQEPRLMGLRSHIVLRSRYAEDRLAQAYARGIRQYLLLGAGLDTFAWRQPPGWEDLHIFEADHPATQAQKKSRLEQAGIRIPANCEMVPVNFETDSLDVSLRKSNFDFTIPTFISCLGVMIYLSAKAIDGIFNFVIGLPATSEFVFTFSQRRMTPESQETATRVAGIGEPWRSFQRPDELAWKLGKLGYTSLEFLQPEEAEALYYAGRPHGLPAPTHCNMATVIV